MKKTSFSVLFLLFALAAFPAFSENRLTNLHWVRCTEEGRPDFRLCQRERERRLHEGTINEEEFNYLREKGAIPAIGANMKPYGICLCDAK